MSNIEQLTIGPGSVVTMYFNLTMKANGIVADCTNPGEPLTFTMGDGWKHCFAVTATRRILSRVMTLKQCTS